MQQDIFQQGFDLMLFGMGTVFLFLTLLVLATTLMSSAITRFFSEELPSETSGSKPAPIAHAVTDPKLIAVLQAAVDQHRKTKR